MCCWSRSATDRETGRFRGFGFVEMNREEVEQRDRELDGYQSVAAVSVCRRGVLSGSAGGPAAARQPRGRVVGVRMGAASVARVAVGRRRVGGPRWWRVMRWVARRAGPPVVARVWPVFRPR